MKAICVDDEEQTLQSTLSLCRQMARISDAQGFTDPKMALAWVKEHPVDLAILDISMPGMDGLALARAIQERDKNTAILYLTAHAHYAVDAWAVHPTGFILKPLTEERLLQELDYAVKWRSGRLGRASTAHIEVHTFGNFDLLVDGSRISFARAKAKELLACLIDRRGIRMPRAEIFRLLWDEEEYTRPKQKMLDVIIRSLRATLEENGAGEILKIEQGGLRIEPTEFDCDLYRLLSGDEEAMREYQGEYMSAYPWASSTEGRIDMKLQSLDA